MQTDDAPSGLSPSTNFSVLRVNRDVGSRSRVGFIGTAKRPSSVGGNNFAAGADAQLNLRDDVALHGFFARTSSPADSGDVSSYRGRFDWNGDRYGLNLEHLYVGEGFNPEVGFMRRSAFRRSFGQARFSPRPARIPAVRKFTWQASADYITAATGGVQSQEYQAAFNTELASGDFINTEFTHAFEHLDADFEVARGVTVPIGGYRFTQAKASYVLGPQRPVSGTLTVAGGGLYDGTLTEVSWRGRLEFSPQLYAEPTLAWNRVRGPFGNGQTNVASTRLTYTLTPRMFAAALVQYQSRISSMSTNLRFRWEYQPGSELFVVYSDGRSTLGPRYPELENRSVVVKFTKLFRW
jgi:hypothetical protein